jgi:nucleoside-diphosphate-sugar epimerase
MRETDAAMRHLDQAVTRAGGIALRYGGFHGAANDGMVEPVRKRLFSIVGDGAGVSSFIHLEDAAAATVLALEEGEPGIYNIVDDEPAPVREWLPVLADVLGAKPPRRVPRWVARLFAGEAVVMMEPSRAARRTRRPSASWDGSCATRAGGRGSSPRTADDRKVGAAWRPPATTSSRSPSGR